MKYKKGDKVKVTSVDPEDIRRGIKMNSIYEITDNDWMHGDGVFIGVSPDQESYVYLDQIVLATPSWDTLQVGDIIVDEEGFESEVLAVLPGLFARSEPGDELEMKLFGEWMTEYEAKELGWRIKGAEVTEFTRAEIAEKMGVKVEQLKIKD